MGKLISTKRRAPKEPAMSCKCSAHGAARTGGSRYSGLERFYCCTRRQEGRWACCVHSAGEEGFHGSVLGRWIPQRHGSRSVVGVKSEGLSCCAARWPCVLIVIGSIPRPCVEPRMHCVAVVHVSVLVRVVARARLEARGAPPSSTTHPCAVCCLHFTGGGVRRARERINKPRERPLNNRNS